MLPPIASQMARVMLRPRPVPPNLRVLELSTCTKGSKMRSSAVAAMPTPVSSTRISTPWPPLVSVTRTRTVPCSVNLTALPTRLSSTWRRRNGSISTQQGRGKSRALVSVRPFSTALGVHISMVSSTSCARSICCGCRSMPCAPKREYSRMLLIRPRRCSPQRRITVMPSVGLLTGAPPSSMLDMPRMPCSGVRNSWLMLATNSFLARFSRRASSSADDRRLVSSSLVKRSVSISTMWRSERRVASSSSA